MLEPASCASRPHGLLVIGVLSWHRNDSLRRRAKIREHLTTRPGTVDLRFVLPALHSAPVVEGGVDGDAADAVTLPLRSDHRMELVGKFFLSNAWLRYATSCSIAVNYTFVARLDDDALINGSALANLLPPLLSERYVALGSMRHWYNWEPRTFYAVCWGNNANRARTSRLAFSRLMKARWPTSPPLGRKPHLYDVGRWAALHGNHTDWSGAADLARAHEPALAAQLTSGARLRDRGSHNAYTYTYAQHTFASRKAYAQQRHTYTPPTYCITHLHAVHAPCSFLRATVHVLLTASMLLTAHMLLCSLLPAYMYCVHAPYCVH